MKSIPVEIEKTLKYPEYQYRQHPEGLPKLHFLMGLFGNRNAGKTLLLMKLLRSYIANECFDHIFLFCPTANIEPKYQALLYPLCEISHNYEITNELKKPMLHIYENPTKEDISKMLSYLKEQQQSYKRYLKQLEAYEKFTKYGYEKLTITEEALLNEFVIDEYTMLKPTSVYKSKPSALLIFDDCVYNKSIFSNSELNNSFIKHRHEGWSAIITSQTLRGNGTTLNKQLRNNLTNVCLWGCKDKQMRKDFAQTLAHIITPEKVDELWDDATKEQHDFLYIDYNSPPDKMFRKNLNQAYSIE